MLHIPLQDLHATADATQGGDAPLSCFEDALADALVKWFKPNFMTWADPIMCQQCGGETQGTLTEYRVFPAAVLVRIPDALGWEEAATLVCAGMLRSSTVGYAF